MLSLYIVADRNIEYLQCILNLSLITEVCEDWGVSRAQGYKIIKQLNERMLAINPNLIVLSGKANRKFYEENCYGMAKEA